MTVEITQFHVSPQIKACLKTICPGALVYLDGLRGPRDPVPTYWSRVSFTNPLQLPQTRPYKRILGFALQFFQFEEDLTGPFAEKEELIRLCNSTQMLASH
jgi:hypothetical protein